MEKFDKLLEDARKNQDKINEIIKDLKKQKPIISEKIKKIKEIGKKEILPEIEKLENKKNLNERNLKKLIHLLIG